MSTFNMNHGEIRTKLRQLLGVTDAASGGPVDADLDLHINQGLNRFAALSGGLQSVHKLSTKASDKYLPLIDEILWPKTVSFVDSDGKSYPLGLVEVAPRPGTLGNRPTVWWLTAVNVPDINGPSTRSIGIDPYVSYDGNGNVLVEDIQMPQETSGSATPEIHGCVHSYIAYFAAVEAASLFPERLGLVPMWEAMCKEGLGLFNKLTKPAAFQPKTFKDSMAYRRRARSKF